MIEYIKGELTELTPALATVEAAGVGYGLNISLNTYTALQKEERGERKACQAVRLRGYPRGCPRAVRIL